MTTITLLGLDPSLTNTGYVVAVIDCQTRTIQQVIEHGTIVTAPSKNKKVRKSSDALERARSIAKTLQGVIAKHGIKIASSEIPSGAQSASACYAFGISVGLLASLPVPIIEVSPREVKLATAGTATADKEDIVRWAVALTEQVGGSEHWNTSKAANDWEIKVGDRFVTKTMEHQADAIAGVKAAIDSEQFRQLAGVLLSLVG